ncbi:hypothetical protein [Ruminococcus flavefaciens]|uniref:hypothetical protein n=1 Tax=Ruminococcus flavefaciens TaxID=1265 RepID=UPI0026F0C667|nr:hypothetical protein [Ruminococcus flavefaciens]
MQEKEIMERCRLSFKTHKAKMLHEDDRYFILDWRRADGSVTYYVNYIVDKERGALIVSGDLGESIAVWYNSVTPEKLSSWISDIGYYIGKIKCSSDLYTYDSDDVIEDMKQYISDEDLSAYAESNYRYDSADDVLETMKEEIEPSVTMTSFIPSKELSEILVDMDENYWEWIGSCGRRIDLRVYLWAVGFQMAIEQLKEEVKLCQK